MNIFKKQRLLNEITQMELFKVTGVSPCRISLIERGIVAPKPEERELLTRALINIKGIKNECSK